MKNSGYCKQFRIEVLMAGLKVYNKILEDNKNGVKPIYRSKEWKTSARRMDKQKNITGWLGTFYKSFIFVPPTPGGELQNRMQLKEQELRAGGREMWAIKIIETAGRPLERAIVFSDPFGGNKCTDKKCLPTLDPANKLKCRRTLVCCNIPANCA